jgi:regulator of sigma E protease
MIESIGGLFNGIVAVVVVLGACIFFHELGHFTLAKMIGMKVEEFAIGFGRALFGFKRGETHYRVNLIPLGGYVRIAGMEPGAEPDPRGFYAFPRWKGASVLIAGSLMNVVLAALAFFAVTLASGIGVFPGKEINVRKVLPDTPAAHANVQPGDKIVALDGIEHGLLLEDVAPDDLGAEAGLTRYTRILQVNGEQVALPHEVARAMVDARAADTEEGADNGDAEDEPPTVSLEVYRFNDDGTVTSNDPEVVELPVPPGLPDQIQPQAAGPLLERTLGITLAPIGPSDSIGYISDHPKEPVELTLLRDGRRVKTTVTPDEEYARVPTEDESGRMTAAHKAVGRIGVVLHGATRPASLGEAFDQGIRRSVEAVVLTADWMIKMITGEVAPQASGPVGIAAVTADRARIGWTAVASVAGLISANLAIINMLPFPPFDGFRIVLLAIEGVMGRRVNEKVEIGVTVSGVAILLGLFLVITFRDIFNLVLFQTP